MSGGGGEGEVLHRRAPIRGVRGEGRKHIGQWGSGGVGETTECCELNLLNKLFSSFALSRLFDDCLPLTLHPVICFIPGHISLTLFCWSLASAFPL